MQKRPIAAIVPAAGLGTRMKSSVPKFLHQICGQTVITHILKSLENQVDEIVVVVGNGKEEVIAEVVVSCDAFKERIRFVEQPELLGSGHATKIGMTQVSENIKDIIVVLGDMPLVSSKILAEMISQFQDSKAGVYVSTAHLAEPFGYGRIVRDENNVIKKIVEEKDCDDSLRKITECNMYPFLFEKDFLEIALDKLDTNNSQGEQYLTDVVEIARESNIGVGSYLYEQERFAKGANDRAQLSELEQIMREELNKEFMKNGVTMKDPNSVYIDSGVEIGTDVTILPNVYIEGKTTVASGCVIGPNTRIIDSIVGENCIIESSKLNGVELKTGVTVGPFASLRPETVLEENVHVGSFVEIKKSKVGKNSKVPHLSYVGDATIGENTNLGAGTTTANYDGKNKHKTVIGNNVKTGVNTVLVAPVSLGDNSYTGAGAVVIKDVPEGALAKGVPAENDDDWTPPV